MVVQSIGLWGVDIHSPQDVVTITAALAGIAWVYVNVLRPCVRGLRHGVLIVATTAQALGVLDELPAWMKKHDADRAAIESELGIVHARVSKIENMQQAMARDLGIDVRQLGVDVRELGVDVRGQRAADTDIDGPSESA